MYKAISRGPITPFITRRSCTPFFGWAQETISNIQGESWAESVEQEVNKARARTETKETQLRTFYRAQDWSWNQEKRSSSKATRLARMLNIHSTNDTKKMKTKAFAPQSFQGLSTRWQAPREPVVHKLGVFLHWKSQENTVFPPAWSVRLFKSCAKSHSCWHTASNSSRSCKLENWSPLSCHVWTAARRYKDEKSSWYHL